MNASRLARSVLNCGPAVSACGGRAATRLVIAVAQTFRRASRRFGGRARTKRTKVPAGLQRAAAVRASTAEPLAALRTRVEIDSDGGPAAGAQRTHLAHFGHHAQQ